METSLWDTDLLPIMSFDPDIARARRLAAHLDLGGLSMEVAPTTAAMLAEVHEKRVHTLVVVADLDEAVCLAFIDELRRSAPHSWLVVASPRADAVAEALVHRHGVDALISMPILLPEFISRLTALQLRARTQL
jgi:DNA-binding response OmpR family regulator